MPTPNLGMQKNPFYAKTVFLKRKQEKKKGLTAQPAITNHALIQADTNTVNIHVQIWMGPLIDFSLYIVQSPKGQCAFCLTEQWATHGCWSNQNYGISASKHLSKKQLHRPERAQGSAFDSLTVQLYLKFRSDIVIVALPGALRGLCHMSANKHECGTMNVGEGRDHLT